MPAHTRSRTAPRSRVLVVDDELLITRKLCELLELSGFETDFALSGSECLDKLDDGPGFDVVVLDIDLGVDEAHGGVVATEIWKRFRVPVVFYTGHTDHETIALVRDSDGFGIVAKGPNDAEFVLASIDSAMRRRRAEEARRLTRAEATALFDWIPTPICVVAPSGGSVRYANASFTQVFGGDLSPNLAARLSRPPGTREDSEPVYDARNDRWWSIAGRTIADEAVVWVFQDVTDLYSQLDQMRAQTDLLETLLVEVNHRARNNLSIVESLLAIAEREEPEERNLSLVQSHVRAVRLLHERLYRSGEHVRVDLATYLDEIVDGLLPATGQPVETTVDVPSTHVHGQRALPLGLIVVELATNAQKHSFAESEACWFRVRLRETDDSYTLSVEYNGTPLPPPQTLRSSDGRGLRLIDGLVRQLHGTLRIERDSANRFVIRFPKTSSPRASGASGHS